MSLSAKRKREKRMKSYVFPVVIEPDDDVCRTDVPERVAGCRNVGPHEGGSTQEHPRGGSDGDGGTIGGRVCPSERISVRPTARCGYRMSVDYSGLRSLIARQLAPALQTDGLNLARQKGSQRRYVYPNGRRVILSFHHVSGHLSNRHAPEHHRIAGTLD